MGLLFNCPACTAALDYEDGGATTVRCPFCNNTVIVPEALRRPPKSQSAPITSPTSKVNSSRSRPASGLPRNQAELEALLGELSVMATGEAKIEAIKLYQEKFGVSLREAKYAVDLLAEGKLAQVTQQALDDKSPVMPTATKVTTIPSGNGRSLLASIGFSLAVFLFFFLTIGVPILASVLAAYDERTHRVSIWGGNMNPFAKARVSLAFGEEGSGPGLFTQPTHVTADEDGNIYVTNRADSRIQRFDPEGNYVSFWVVNANTDVRDIAASTNGLVYVLQDSQIYRYEGATGNLLGQLDAGDERYAWKELVPLADGGLIVTFSDGGWLRFSRAGEVVQHVPNPVAELNGKIAHLAVDGLGNIYAIGEVRQRTGSVATVFLFTPDGKFVSRFGSSGEEAGQFQSPGTLAVDGKQRIYVSDSHGMRVFDANGRHLYNINRIVYTDDMAINGRNQLLFVHRYFNKIIRYELRD
jgi:LSD1 subclass zinc finger protein